MFTAVLERVLIPGMNAVVGWFGALVEAMDGFSVFFFAMFFVITVYRFLIAPLLGGKHFGSDKAKHTKNDSSSKRQADNMEG